MIDNMAIIRDARMNAISPDGGWVLVKGSPRAFRGKRIPSSLIEEGVEHMAIYWAYDEECQWTNPLKVKTRGFGGIWEDDDIQVELEDNPLVKDSLDHVDYICESNGIECSLQLTWMTLHTPSSKLIRVFCGEVSPISTDMIAEMLEENYIQTVSFATSGGNVNPIWDDATKDMVGSLMLDGLSLNESQDMLIRAGEKIERASPNRPSYFYRSAGDFRNQFYEESAYEKAEKR